MKHGQNEAESGTLNHASTQVYMLCIVASRSSASVVFRSLDNMPESHISAVVPRLRDAMCVLDRYM